MFSSVPQSCLMLCDPMDCSTPGIPVHHQLPEPAQTHVHRVGDAIQPSHSLLSPSPPVFSLSQHQVKNPPANSGDIRDADSIRGSGRSPGEGHGNLLQYSVHGESHGQRSLVGYSPWSFKDLDTACTHTAGNLIQKHHSSAPIPHPYSIPSHRPAP